MKIPLDTFEQYVDETILKRGLQYFKKGYVGEPELISPGEFEVLVEGTETYVVNLKIDNNEVTEFVCTCPYDFGPVCKHVVAALFYLLKDELGLEVRGLKSAKSSAKPKSKRKSVAEQVEDLLDIMPHEELKDFVREKCDSDRNFRQLFVGRHAYRIIPESKELYAKQVKAILQDAKGRKGYIDYYEVRNVGNEVYEMVQNAEQLLNSGNTESAMYMAIAILEEMTKALDYSDDSNADIGTSVESSISILYSISELELPERIRKYLFEYCIESYKKKIYAGWNWHSSMLTIAVEIQSSDEEVKQIYELLDTIKPKRDDLGWDWDYRQAQRIRLSLIRKTEGEEQAEKYMEENISNSDFRKAVIEKAIAQNDYAKAISLCQQGIKAHKGTFEGLVTNWMELLLKVYQQQNDINKVLELSRTLFLESHMERKPYFDVLKKNISKEEWNGYVDGLVMELKTKSRWGDSATVAQIYVWEERWSDLLNIVRKDVSLRAIDVYSKYLVKEFPSEMADLYQMAILKDMEVNVGRNHYQNACRYLRRMIKMGERDKANVVIDELRRLYPKRRALMEELQKV